MTFLQRRELYEMFLQSEWWADLSRRKRSQVKTCERCGSPKRLQSHHRFYRDNWFDTQLSDLEVLCRPCHRTEHGIIPATESPITLPDEVGKTAPKRLSTKSAHMEQWRRNKGPQPKPKSAPPQKPVFHPKVKRRHRKKFKSLFAGTALELAQAQRRISQIRTDAKPGNSHYIIFPSGSSRHG